MKLASWNVNGLRSSWDKGLYNFIKDQKPDVLCIQEIKALEDQLSEEQKHPVKYNSFFFSAEKPGYSGVAIYSKKEPIGVRYGFGHKLSDQEGRVLTVEYSDFILINAYFPNSQREHTRLGFKIDFCEHMQSYCEEAIERGKNIVLCGDFNVAHTEIDLANPKSNMNNAGFLPEERAWMDGFLKAGFVDTFRLFEKSGGHYTWWSYRPGVREKNIGWRLDYHCINNDFKDKVKSSKIFSHIKGSDHCPILLTVAD